jgi:hypothetical protein
MNALAQRFEEMSESREHAMAAGYLEDDARFAEAVLGMIASFEETASIEFEVPPSREETATLLALCHEALAVLSTDAGSQMMARVQARAPGLLPKYELTRMAADRTLRGHAAAFAILLGTEAALHGLSPEDRKAGEDLLTGDLNPDAHPVFRALRLAPFDDEPLTESELEALEDGRRDIAEGRTRSLEDVARELGVALG